MEKINASHWIGCLCVRRYHVHILTMRTSLSRWLSIWDSDSRMCTACELGELQESFSLFSLGNKSFSSATEHFTVVDGQINFQ